MRIVLAVAGILLFPFGALVGIFFTGEMGSSPGYLMLAGLLGGVVFAILPFMFHKWRTLTIRLIASTVLFMIGFSISVLIIAALGVSESIAMFGGLLIGLAIALSPWRSSFKASN